MNKSEREIQAKDKAAIYRDMMISYVINDYEPMGRLHFRRFKRKQWANKVHAMTMAQLIQEFEDREGPEWLAMSNGFKSLSHCCTKLDKEGHPI